MRRKIISVLAISALSISLLAGCGGKSVDNYFGNNTQAPGNEPTEKDPDAVNITPAESATIEWENYTTADGYITCKKPVGWGVYEEPGDVIGYQIKIYDTKNPSRMVYFSPTVTGYKSPEAVELAARFDNTGADWSTCPINSGDSTSTFFPNSGQFWGYTNFSEIANLGENGWGGDILQASCTYENVECEGIFTSATTFPLGKMNYFGVDVGPVAEYGTTIMLAPAADFPSWEPVLMEIFSSITMTDAYQQARAAAWKKIIGTSEQLAAAASYSSDLIMSGWESRNNTYDILSQRNSDATMGRDRVYDTETGDVYYTDLGWYDTYEGTRFQYIGEGSDLYNLPVTGTIY